MYKLMAFISRKPGTSPEEFRAYYESKHTKVIAEVAPPMAAYRRNYLKFGEAFSRSEELIDFDVVVDMEFVNREDCQRWFDAFRNPDAFAKVLEDERQFLDADRVRVCVVEVCETEY